MIIVIMRSADTALPEFAVRIVLPDGRALETLTRRKALITAAKIRETMRRAPPRRTEVMSRKQRRITTYQQRMGTAYHEAGHAVIGRVLTLPCGGANIKRNYAEMTAGYSITPDPYACEWEWEKRGKVRGNKAIWHARIITLMAGAEAEKILLGQAPEMIGDGDDRHWIGLMLEEVASAPNWERYEARLRAITGMLVRRHRLLIRRVAKALLAKRVLSANQIDALTGRSVEDVGINAPWLVFTHATRGASGLSRLDAATKERLRVALGMMAEKKTSGAKP